MDSLRKIKKALHMKKPSDASDPGSPEPRPDIYEQGSTTIVDKWGRDRRLRHSRSLSELQRNGSRPAWLVDSDHRDPSVWAHPNHKKRHVKPSEITYILDIKPDSDDEDSDPTTDMPVLEMNRRYPSERLDSDRPPKPPPKDNETNPNDGFRNFSKAMMNTSLQTPGDPPSKPKKPKTMNFDSIAHIDPGLDLLPPNPTYNPERRERFIANIERERRAEMAAIEAANAQASRERRERGLAKFEEQQRQARRTEREEADRSARKDMQDKAFEERHKQVRGMEREQREEEEREEADRLARRKMHEKVFKEKEAQLPSPLQRSTSTNVAPLRGMPFPKQVQATSLGTSHARYWSPNTEQADENGFRTQGHGGHKRLVSNPTPSTSSKMKLEKNEHLRDGPTAHRVVVHQNNVSVDPQPTRPLHIRKPSIESTASTRPLHVRPRNPSLDSTASRVTPFVSRTIHQRLRDPTYDIPRDQREQNPIHLVDPEAILQDTQRPRRFKVSLETDPIYRDEAGFFRPLSHARKQSQSSTHTTPTATPEPGHASSSSHTRSISTDSRYTPSRSRNDSSSSSHNPPSYSPTPAAGHEFPRKKRNDGPPPAPSQRHRGERIVKDGLPSRPDVFKRPHIEPLRGNSHLHV